MVRRGGREGTGEEREGGREGNGEEREEGGPNPLLVV